MRRFKSVKALCVKETWVENEESGEVKKCPYGCKYCQKLEYEQTHKLKKEYQTFNFGNVAVDLQTKQIFYAEPKDSTTYYYTPVLSKDWKVVDILSYQL
jgi:hypothetical protein